MGDTMKVAAGILLAVTIIVITFFGFFVFLLISPDPEVDAIIEHKRQMMQNYQEHKGWEDDIKNLYRNSYGLTENNGDWSH